MIVPLLELPAHLDTERLVLRPYAPGDAAAYLRLCLDNKAHLVPYEEGNPALEIETLRQAEDLVGAFAREWARRSAFFLGAWRRDDDALVAQVYVGVVAWQPPEFEFGYFVDAGNEGRGYVTEAVRAAVAFAFDHLGAQRLRLSCDETNERSWRVAERCGFSRVAHLPETQRHARLPDGRWGGDYLYAIEREAYDRART